MPSIQRAEEGLPGNAPETDHEEVCPQGQLEVIYLFLILSVSRSSKD
jgi:hypothetical protein